MPSNSVSLTLKFCHLPSGTATYKQDSVQTNVPWNFLFRYGHFILSLCVCQYRKTCLLFLADTYSEVKADELSTVRCCYIIRLPEPARRSWLKSVVLRIYIIMAELSMANKAYKKAATFPLIGRWLSFYLCYQILNLTALSISLRDCCFKNCMSARYL